MTGDNDGEFVVRIYRKPGPGAEAQAPPLTFLARNFSRNWVS